MTCGTECTDQYLLRNLVWCGLCGAPMVACLMSTGIRYYGCTSTACPRPLVPADEAEQQVWGRFVDLNEAVADILPPDRRRQSLRLVLRRVVVGATGAELRLHWRD